MSFFYSIEDIRVHFSSKNYQRGVNYERNGNVSKITIDEDNQIFTSYVNGSGNNSYNVYIKIGEEGDFPLFQGQCSCPVGVGCKHIVATLIKGLTEMSSNAPRQIDPVTKETPQETLASLPYKLESWLKELEETEGGSTTNPQQERFIIYLIDQSEGSECAFKLFPIGTSINKNKTISKTRSSINLNDLDYHPPKYATEDDLTLLRIGLSLIKGRRYSRIDNWHNIHRCKASGMFFDLLIETGRCYFKTADFLDDMLRKGESRKETLYWVSGPDGIQTVQVRKRDDEALNIFPIILDPIRYVCMETKQVGLLDLGIPPKQALSLLTAPFVPPENSVTFVKKMGTILGGNSKTLIPRTFLIEYTDFPPIPVLNLESIDVYPRYRYRYGDKICFIYASLSFAYGEKMISYTNEDKSIQSFKDGKVFETRRDFKKEKAGLKHLQSLGFTMSMKEVSRDYQFQGGIDGKNVTIREYVEALLKKKKTSILWETFMKQEVPKLKELGWKITMSRDFPYNIIQAEDNWYADVIGEGENSWFDIELGVIFDKERINLVPIFIALLRDNPRIFEELDKIQDKENYLLSLKDGRRLSLPAARIKMLLTTIHQLFSFQNFGENDKIKVNILDAALLAEMELATKSLQLRWFGDEFIRQLGNRLKNFKRLTTVLPPKTFKGQLRDYQQEGLNWLQFLREYKLAGILADDMGLGKTVQVLAHIATEKNAGRLDNPFLVVAPTSLMFNWKMEAEHFTPHLKVLVLHGSDRKKHFKTLEMYDIVLTTYPLLIRDKEELISYSYHTIVLDEAQTIKNARAKMTQITNQLKSTYRLCMTGTPFENHLGELWSLFNFLLPGYLGNSRKFTELFRTPIEKEGNKEKSLILSRRIRPFVMRRSKQNVVKELPPKTEIIHMVELEGAQRDLYETIRVSMQKKVRDEIQAHGVEKSHIFVLDALLKLRQICCDPSLLKINSVKENTASVKLDELFSLFERMIPEGRKILLFSQFTSMLSIIEKKLEEYKIPYVILTGETRDRAGAIRQFQDGDTQVFLISLKAGGVGLNLTAADTVIHYDPWWNPAVENQATDRAYRIGQDKPVFVYKLITLGTVEEKIMEMQKKKAKFMDNLFDSDEKCSAKLTSEDIQVLFDTLW